MLLQIPVQFHMATPKDLTNTVKQRQHLYDKVCGLGFTHRPQNSSFLGLPYRILNMNPKRELWVGPVQSSIEFCTEAYCQRTRPADSIVNLRKLEHGFRRISARIPYTLP